MSTRRAIVIGASAGGVEALRAVVAGLPADLAAPVVVVLHIPRTSPSALPGILDRAGPLPAVAAAHCMRLRDGVVHVAPADHHVLIVDGLLQLSSGPLENGHRPAIDPLFRSAALSSGPGAVGVVLSGTRDDGSAGLAAIADQGGSAVVQDPSEALYAAMPSNALRLAPSALVAPASAIGAVLGDLVRRPLTGRDAAAEGGSPSNGRGAAAGPSPSAGHLAASAGTSPSAGHLAASAGTSPSAGAAPAADLLGAEAAQAATGLPTTDQLPDARPSPFSCPDCHGVLFELPGGPAPRFRCRVGHAWSPASLEDEQAVAVDNALWVALRALEEKAGLVERLAGEAEKLGHHRSTTAYRSRAAEARNQAEQVRALVRRDTVEHDRLGSFEQTRTFEQGTESG